MLRLRDEHNKLLVRFVYGYIALFSALWEILDTYKVGNLVCHFFMDSGEVRESPPPQLTCTVEWSPLNNVQIISSSGMYEILSSRY